MLLGGYAALLIILIALFADTTLDEFRRMRILCSVLVPCSYCVGTDRQVTTAFLFFRAGESRWCEVPRLPLAMCGLGCMMQCIHCVLQRAASMTSFETAWQGMGIHMTSGAVNSPAAAFDSGRMWARLEVIMRYVGRLLVDRDFTCVGVWDLGREGRPVKKLSSKDSSTTQTQQKKDAEVAAGISGTTVPRV
jgi:hypothetical protein